MAMNVKVALAGDGFCRLTLLLTLVFISVFTTGCWMGSPAIDIIVENQTGQVLTVFVSSSKPSGTIAPGQRQIVKSLSLDEGRYPIVAKNLEGKVVFSETYTFYPDGPYHLIETNLRHKGVVNVYKAIIPPLTTLP